MIRHIVLRIVIGIAPAFLSVLALPMTAGAAPADASAVPAAKPVLGYLNPKTDIFTPLAAPSKAVPAPASAAVSPDAAAGPIVRRGVLVITGNIAIDPSVPADATFSANVTATVTDAKFVTSVGLGGVVKRSGDTGKLTLKMPYVFTAAAASEVVTISFQMSSSTGESIYLSETIPLPANDATTTVAIGEKA